MKREWEEGRGKGLGRGEKAEGRKEGKGRHRTSPPLYLTNSKSETERDYNLLTFAIIQERRCIHIDIGCAGSGRTELLSSEGTSFPSLH